MKTRRPNYRVQPCCANCRLSLHGHCGEVYCDYWRKRPVYPQYTGDRINQEEDRRKQREYLSAMAAWELENLTEAGAVCDDWAKAHPEDKNFGEERKA